LDKTWAEPNICPVARQISPPADIATRRTVPAKMRSRSTAVSSALLQNWYNHAVFIID
jgi:hypothetical protein